ncbi:S8 family serine peptidase [uncultured Merdimonas sp.]|uniref:S8 family peptidase n=1 Tax=uncultured Merdimonas sp. TaxID=2023269 RepID=UPI003209415C
MKGLQKFLQAAGLCLFLWILSGPELLHASEADMETEESGSQIIVLYEDARSQESGSRRIQELYGEEIRDARELGGTVEVLTVAEDADADAVIETLSDRPEVAAVGRDRKIPLHSLPNDPYVQNGAAWQFTSIGADQVWDTSPGAAVVKVAVIDTGVMTEHEDLAGRCEIGYDYISGSDRSMTDLIGHGTQIAGVIAATANNGVGIAGTAGAAPVRVVAYRAGGEDPSDEAVRLSYVIAALEEIRLRQDIQVVNLSIGGTEPDALEEAAIQRVLNAGKIVVASAGNRGTGEYNYPASYDGVISVGAVSRTEEIAYFSNYNSRVDLCAPGQQVVTTGRTGGYVSASGTSFAAPIAAGAAAVLKQRCPDLTAVQVEQILKKTAEDKGTPGRDDYYGAGLIDLGRAVEEAESLLAFQDVPLDAWYYDPVKYVFEKGIMTGLNQTTFGAVEALARAQFAVILYRMNGEPAVEGTADFPDVSPGTWYTDAVSWAAAEGVVTGYSDTGNFGPGDEINREQMAVMMYRYAKSRGYDVGQRADFSGYQDAALVHDFAGEAMQWAVGTGIISGKYDQTLLDPLGQASRAECATIIMRFLEYYGA